MTTGRSPKAVVAPRGRTFDDARADAVSAAVAVSTPQTRSASYRLAYNDPDFLLREDLRPVRFQLELLKPQLMLDEAKIASTFVIYGSARSQRPSDKATRELDAHLVEARRLAALASQVESDADGNQHFVVCSGGGPAIMEAANLGAAEAGRPSIGLNIVLPREQVPNQHVTPEFAFQFHSFALRKLHILLRARAVAVFPGGFGTLDELFDLLTLMQTGKMAVIPLLLFDEPFWRELLNFDALIDRGLIASRDASLLQFVTSAEEAWNEVVEFYNLYQEPKWHTAGEL